MANSFTKSYTCDVNKAGKITIKPSHFVPGYSSLHKETPQEAKDAYVKHLQAEINDLQNKINIINSSEKDD